MKRLNTVPIFALIAFFLFPIFTDSYVLSGQKEEIQKELDINPFLKKEGVKLRVTEAVSGYITIEMYEGSRYIREEIADGEEIPVTQVDEALFWQHADKIEKKALSALRRTIAYVKNMRGVKDVMVVAAVNTKIDQATDMYEKALSYAKENNYTEEIKWYRKAADLGFALAQNNLGVMYADGKGVAQDYKEAIKWFRMAANQGDDNAQINLAIRYLFGEGVVKDYKEAAKWLRMAANQGNAIAQNYLGIRYANGQGVVKDYKEAVMWHRKAANQGHAGAQSNLGHLYFNGKGVAQDHGEAIKWFQKAIRQGSIPAYNGLAWLFATCNDKKFQNGKLAIKNALIATQKRKHYAYLDTLAAAYARDGQFDLAIKTQQKAISKTKRKEIIRDLASRLDLYKAGKAFTQGE